MRYIQHKRHLPPDTIKMFLTKQLSKKRFLPSPQIIENISPNQNEKNSSWIFFFFYNWVFEYFPSDVMLKQTIFEFDQTGK